MAFLERWRKRSFCLLVVASYLAARLLVAQAGKEYVCSNIDIRNSVRNFRKLENCTVIEGYLQIVLIDKGNAKDYDHLSFPKLREITGYLFLYRAYGLNSLGKLFPNLAVIRGSTLFHNYALVVFEMFHLQEIGLGSLVDILRGSVRIEKNPALCYVDTVDWDRIARAGRGGHFIKDNKPRAQCPDTCPSNCSVNPRCPASSSVGDGHCRLCWNSNTCQKVCPASCEQQNRSCMLPRYDECCSKECVGGCYGTTATECIACRRVAFQNRCFESCPRSTYEYIGRRCLNERDCRAISSESSNQATVYWKPFMNQCLPECPPHYTEKKEDKHVCVRCADRCPKVCSGRLVVDSVASAQNLHGCTIINGSLEIQIQGGSNIIRELEENLNSIQEITDFLKVARSFPLVSLNFLKNLTVIRGERLDRNYYALLVLNNQNLQELWDAKRPLKLNIPNGKIFFHFNAKLCLSKIDEMRKYARVADWDDRDVSPSSNGDGVACDVTNIDITILRMSSSMVWVQWPNFRTQIADTRSLIGYVIYYREAPYRNITIYDGRDACGKDMWKVDDVQATDNEQSVKYLITQLKPFTQYAIYIQTYTISSAQKGAQSQIMYITTKPDTPTFPVNVRAFSTHQGEILVQWSPPKLPNGNVTHYIIEGVEETDSPHLVSQRNYCHESSSSSNYNKGPSSDRQQQQLDSERLPQKSPLNGSEPAHSGECCSCQTEKAKLDKDVVAEQQILFEDFVHNTVYVKNPHAVTESRSGGDLKRAIPTRTPGHLELSSSQRPPLLLLNPSSTLQPPTNHKEEQEDDVPEGGGGELPADNSTLRFHHVVYHQHFLRLSNLKHFTEYIIAVSACQDKNPDLKAHCSIKAITSIRTLPLGGADDVEGLVLRNENSSRDSITLRWEEPKNPNGMIVAYHVEYRKIDSDNVKPFVECVPRPIYRETRSYTLVKLQPGNYSLKVRAASLAGDGNWTTPQYFWIPENNDTSPGFVAVIIGVAVVIVIAALSVGMWVFIKRKYGAGVPDGILYASVNPEYMSAGLVYEPDEWEVPREKIKLVRELGQGSFGMVYEGEAKDILPDKDFVQCAVKTVNESSSLRERIEFLQEASVMKAFNCHHVIKLLGVVSKGHPTLVIMELMARGDLKSYLRSHRPDNEENLGRMPPTLPQILQMMLEIADGMAYLAAKKFVHRDLAARNCMVAKDLTVKIGDFGMTRDIYETDYYRKGGKGLLPVRWMAPESLKDGVFTSQSDVWSYGVVLWEIATLASQPYQGLSNEQVLKYVGNGGVMERPENCPDRLYNLMTMCWERNPKARPTFTELIEILLPDVGPHFREVSFYFKQRPLMCPQDTAKDLDEATPTTPLRGCSLPGNGGPSLEEEEEGGVNFFPSATLLPDEPHSIHSGRTSSSEGSKGSKISNTSNGSLANGHIPARTTVC